MSSIFLPDDEQFNISFVQTVEKYPCLYDSTLKTYNNRSEQDKAWNKVAVLYYSTGTECKKKWKILRGSLTRYLKHRNGKKGDPAAPKKKYYLWNVMQFVLPFTKTRSQWGNLPNNSEDVKFESDNSSMDDYKEHFRPADHGEHTSGHLPLRDLDIDNTSSSSSKSSNKRKALINEMESAVIGYLSHRTERIPDNPDLLFFKSILPDVGALNTSQKRKFKVMVLQMLEKMLQETNSLASVNDISVSNSSSISSGIVKPNMEQIYTNHT